MKSSKTFLKILPVVVAAAVVVIILISAVGNGRDKRRITLKYRGAGDTVVCADDTELAVNIPGKAVVAAQSADGTACLCMTQTGDGMSLYSVYDAAVRELSGDVPEELEIYISFDGRFAFTRDELGVLTLYDLKRGSGTVVSETAGVCTISPRGKYLLYIDNANGPVLTLYKVASGVGEAVSTRYLPVAVSDDADLIYVTDTESGGFCLIGRNGLEKSRFTSELAPGSAILFTSDLSGVMFSDSEYSYVSVNGGAKTSVGPSGTDTGYEGGNYSLLPGGCRVCGVKRFEF